MTLLYILKRFNAKKIKIDKSEYGSLLLRLHYGNTAWVIHTLFIVLETLKREYDFLDGFKYIVSQGGDTDTNCAIYGAIKEYRQNISDEIIVEEFLENNLVNLNNIFS